LSFPIGKVLSKDSGSIYKGLAHKSLFFCKYSALFLVHKIVDHKIVDRLALVVVLVAFGDVEKCGYLRRERNEQGHQL
ncbi:MAG: hypothetical protein IKX20_09325, partial [Paludibacteraceae bacterium]|nr:hypothetical protein [Paludibacteraceae bacterium]